MSMQTLTEQECKQLGVPLASLVNIWVGPKGGGGWDIRVYPKRSGDAHIYHTTAGSTPTAERPRQILWLVTGLQAGQTVTLSAKVSGAADAGGAKMPQDTYTIVAPCDSILSGEALRSAAIDLNWSYNVTLSDASGQLAQIDPMVVIKEDP